METYEWIERMLITFPMALEFVRNGYKVGRPGAWGDKLYLIMRKGRIVSVNDLGEAEWVPIQDDILADDWMLKKKQSS